MLLNQKSQIDKIETNINEKIAKQQEEIEKLKLACNEIFSNQNGKFFLNYLKNFCGWNSQDMNINLDVLAYQKGKRDVWILIRNVLPKNLLADIEIYGK